MSSEGVCFFTRILSTIVEQGFTVAIVLGYLAIFSRFPLAILGEPKWFS